MSQIRTQTLTGNLQYENTVILTYKITYPEIIFSYYEPGRSIFNKYNKDIAIKLEKYAKTELYKNAVETYKFNKQNGYPIMVYELVNEYTITYNHNYFISLYTDTYEFTGGAHGMTYLDTYNYNLLTGDKLTLKDMFKPGVDYKEIVNNFITEEINNNPEIYFKGDEGFKRISENQSFYIDEDGIVIYFGLYEIAPYYVGIPKFKLKFDEFNKYLNYN